MALRSRALWLLLLAFTAFAQNQQGTITGSVTDVDGAAVANAQVQAKNDKGTEFQAKTSASGSYSLPNLPAGTYEISIASPGLRPFSKDKIVVQAGQTARLDARLADFESLGSLGEDRTFFSAVFEAHKTAAGPTPRTPDGKPDFSGVWHPMRTVDAGHPEALPWAEKLAQERVANNFKDLPTSFCLPGGIFTSGTLVPFRVMQNPILLAVLYEEDLPRQIYLDGRKHPDETLSPFVGHSVGKWDRDTLVVDTVDFNDKTWLENGYPHTEKMRVTERWARKDLGHLEVEITVDDPGALKSPWTIKKATELAGPDDEVGQYVCTENNRDVQHLVGK